MSAALELVRDVRDTWRTLRDEPEGEAGAAPRNRSGLDSAAELLTKVGRTVETASRLFADTAPRAQRPGESEPMSSRETEARYCASLYDKSSDCVY